MADRKDIENLFGRDGNLDREEMLRYLKEEMSREEKHVFEANLLDNELYADAIEGLSLLEDKEAGFKMVDEAEEAFKKRHLKSVKKGPRLPSIGWLAAAAVALIAVVFLMLFNPFENIVKGPELAHHDVEEPTKTGETPETGTKSFEDEGTRESLTELAPGTENEEMPPEMPVLAKEVELAEAEEVEELESESPSTTFFSSARDEEMDGSGEDQYDNSGTLAGVATTKSSTADKTTTGYDSDDGLGFAAEDEIVVDDVNALPQMNQEKSADPYKKDREVGVRSDPGALGAVATSKSTNRKKEEKSNKGLVQAESSEYQYLEDRHGRSGNAVTRDYDNSHDAVSNANEGLQLYHQQKYTEALEAFKKALQVDRSYPKAQYYAAMCLVKLNRLSQAEVALREITRNKAHTYIEESQFELAKVYLRRGKKKQAEKLLKEISKNGGKFASQASKELDKL